MSGGKGGGGRDGNYQSVGSTKLEAYFLVVKSSVIIAGNYCL